MRTDLLPNRAGDAERARERLRVCLDALQRIIEVGDRAAVNIARDALKEVAPYRLR